MSELGTVTESLPEFKTAEHSRALFAESIELVKAATQAVKDGIFEYEAILPEVVGYVDEAERDYFVNFPVEQLDFGVPWLSAASQMPKTKSRILDDLAMLGVCPGNYDEASLTVRPQQLQLNPHIDTGIVTARQIRYSIYFQIRILPLCIPARQRFLKALDWSCIQTLNLTQVCQLSTLPLLE